MTAQGSSEESPRNRVGDAGLLPIDERPPAVWLESRYRKLERGLSQTVLHCPKCRGRRGRRDRCKTCNGFGRLTRYSVEECIGRCLVPAFKAKEGRFHGAGREDVDVLMLGAGRPFVFEVRKPRRLAVDLEQLRADVTRRSDGAVELAPLRFVERDRIVHWKEGHFPKRYRLLVESAAELPEDALQRLEGWAPRLAQRTPERVAHRRADMEREREVAVESVRVVGPTQLELAIRTQHGTYVKEWVSGDGGRTVPSVAERLEIPAECAQLDVLDILDADVESGADPSPPVDPSPPPA